MTISIKHKFIQIKEYSSHWTCPICIDVVRGWENYNGEFFYENGVLLWDNGNMQKVRELINDGKRMIYDEYKE